MEYNGLNEFKGLINTLNSDLEKYASKSNANEYVIFKQNDLIQKLIAIYNKLLPLQYHSAWLEVEEAMEKLEKEEDKWSCWRFRFPTENKRIFFGYIEYRHARETRI